MGRRRDQSSPASRRIAGACGFARHWWPPEIRWLPEMQTTAATSAAKKMAGNNSMAANRCNVMIAPAPVDHNRMFCADRSFCWQCVQPRWSELGLKVLIASVSRWPCRIPRRRRPDRTSSRRPWSEYSPAETARGRSKQSGRRHPGPEKARRAGPVAR
jgi:hypothetical protein